MALLRPHRRLAAPVPSGLMARWPFPSTSQLVMWSSPLLLVVLVLTLHPRTSTTSSATPPTSTPVSSTTTTTTTTTTTVPTTRVAHDSVSTTNSIASTPASTPNVSSDGVRASVAGTLGANNDAISLPLAPSTTWLLRSVAALTSELSCGGQRVPVGAVIHVGPVDCTLTLHNPQPRAVAWELTRTA